MTPSTHTAPARTVTGQRLTGERALFAAQDLTITTTVFADGESPLKHSRGIRLTDSVFAWKYPLWYAEDVTVEGGALLETARSGIWYTHRLTMRGTTVAAPKTFRRSGDLVLEHVDLPHAEETLWSCHDVHLTDVSATGDYLAKDTEHVVADNLRVTGNYAFDGARDVTVRRSTLLSKDAFWNCEDVTVQDSLIVGEYLGWNTRNLTLERCTVQSLQGLCYVENLVLRDCRLVDTTLAFEYSTVDVTLDGTVDSVLNPTAGVIRADGIGELTLDPARVDPTRTTVVTTPGAVSTRGPEHSRVA